MKKRLITMLSLVICSVLFAGVLQMPMTAKANDVKISDVDYIVTYEGATDIFLCNKKSIGSKVGTEVYLTYTVENVDTCNSTTQGVGATGQPDSIFPYTTGVMEYDNRPLLLEEGCTYFYKFEVTKDGFAYTIIKAKDEESSYIDMLYTTGEMTDSLEYFGLWTGGGEVQAKLVNVRCYDREGNDLGVRFSGAAGASWAKDVTYRKNTKLNHSYTVTLEDQHTVALCNLKTPIGNKVYMEYKVASSDSSIIQSGALITQAPDTIFPYSAGNGYMVYETMSKADDGILLLEGAEYIICMEKMEDDLSVTVQRTYKGEKKIFSFPTVAGEYGKQFNYFGLWLGQGTEYPVDCVLTNFKCYDSNNNNLGVQCNRTITTEHSGEIEDYAGCEAIYYCEKENSIIALYEDQTMKYTKDRKTQSGTYHITDAEDKTITLSYGQGKETFEYLYMRFTSDDGRVFERMGTYKLTFVTGNDTNIETQILSPENGYVAKRPNDPQQDNLTFQGWVTKNGTEFDFDSIVTESVTLYAKWSDSEGREIISGRDEMTGNGIDFRPIIAISASLMILVGCVIGCVLFVRRGGKKHGGNK